MNLLCHLVCLPEWLLRNLVRGQASPKSVSANATNPNYFCSHLTRMKDSPRYKILAICGSTRKSSSNLELIYAITDLFENKLQIEIFQDLDAIPHFNPDLDGENPPQKTIDFRQKLSNAEGILICTPEYAMGVPGTLKNALDWTVSSMEFSYKPVALITASSVGQKGHMSLIETLKVIEADIPETSQLVISFVKTKVKGNKIIDESTLLQVKHTIDSLIATIEKKRESETA